MTLLRCALALLLFLAFSACQRGPANLGYDPAKDPVVELEQAKRDAARSGKRVMIIAGGEWCRWCHVLDAFLSDNEDVKSELDRGFVTLKVYVGEENENAAFFEAMPPAPGYPHFWVVGESGIAHSINTGPLESGDNDYDKAKFLAMLRSAAQR